MAAAFELFMGVLIVMLCIIGQKQKRGGDEVNMVVRTESIYNLHKCPLRCCDRILAIMTQEILPSLEKCTNFSFKLLQKKLYQKIIFFTPSGVICLNCYSQFLGFYYRVTQVRFAASFHIYIFFSSFLCVCLYYTPWDTTFNRNTWSPHYIMTILLGTLNFGQI